MKFSINLLCISSFPVAGQTHGKGTVGVASYTKNTLRAIQQEAKRHQTKLNITVLAELLDGLAPHAYEEDGMQINRVWKRNSPLVFIALLNQILQISKTKKILIELELSMFGPLYTLLLFPLFLLLLRILNKEITIVLHQVVLDINTLSGHINIPKDSLLASSINRGIRVFYTAVCHLATHIIVFEEVFKKDLKQFGAAQKTIVIPHGVEKAPRTRSTRFARKQLGLNNSFTLLCFGFLGWYKGSDLIMDAFHNSFSGDKNIQLIIAGGANPNHTAKKFYQDYIFSLYKKGKQNGKNMLITGFVPEEKIALYFQAADVVLFPYRTLMSSSGPLSLAYTFQKPFLISEPMRSLLTDKTIQKVLSSCAIAEKNLILPLQGETLQENIYKLIKSPTLLKRLTKVSEHMAQKRSFATIGTDYYNTICKN